MRTFCVGDMHGSLKGFLQCLERSGFDKEKDKLISLGDITDGYPDVKELINELLTIKNLVFIKSNHDEWALEWMKTGYIEHMWATQGGRATLNSYGYDQSNVPVTHINLIENAHWYHTIGGEDSIPSGMNPMRLFVHGGIDPNKPLEKQSHNLLIWDRDLVKMALTNNSRQSTKPRKQSYKFGGFDEIFVGHTSTTYTVNKDVPTKLCNVWMLDTGAGYYDGKLSIMDIDTHEYWQSDKSKNLYPGLQGDRR